MHGFEAILLSFFNFFVFLGILIFIIKKPLKDLSLKKINEFKEKYYLAEKEKLEAFELLKQAQISEQQLKDKIVFLEQESKKQIKYICDDLLQKNKDQMDALLLDSKAYSEGLKISFIEKLKEEASKILKEEVLLSLHKTLKPDQKNRYLEQELNQALRSSVLNLTQNGV